jgi:hypothetical protein
MSPRRRGFALAPPAGGAVGHAWATQVLSDLRRGAALDPAPSTRGLGYRAAHGSTKFQAWPYGVA